MGAHSDSYILGPAWAGDGSSLEAAISATVAIDAAKFYDVNVREFNSAGHRAAELPKGRVEIAWYGKEAWTLEYVESETGKSLAAEQDWTFEVRDEYALVIVWKD